MFKLKKFSENKSCVKDLSVNVLSEYLCCFNTVSKIAQFFHTFPICIDIVSFPQYNYASDIYEKMEDYEALAALYVETQQWERVGTVNTFK